MAVHIFVRGGGGNFDVLECMHERGVYMGGNFLRCEGRHVAARHPDSAFGRRGQF